MIIVSAANDNYATHLYVMLKSLLVHVSRKSDVRVVIIHSDIAAARRELIADLVTSFGAVIEFTNIQDPDISDIPMDAGAQYVSRETFYRIDIPHLLSPHDDKAIYLDCDIVVLDDLREIWELDISNYHVAAVEDFINVWKKDELIIPSGYCYFNAGLLVLNLHKWRQDHIPSQLKQVLMKRGETLSFMDQDALNLVLYDKMLQLDLRWNYQTHFWNTRDIPNPAIIHFTSSKKPWNSDTPFNDVYHHYLHLQI